MFRNFLKQMQNTFTKGFQVLSETSAFGGFSYESGEQLSDSLARDLYDKSIIAKSPIDLISTVFSSVEFSIFKVLNTKGETEKLEYHEFLDILYKPNVIQTKQEFLEISAINYILSGEIFIKKLFDESGKFIGMINVAPDIMEVEIKDNIVVYTQHFEGKKLVYTADEMIHIKKANIKNPLRGQGLLSSMLSRMTAEQQAMKMLNITMANGGRLDGLLFVKNIDQNAIDGIKKKWRQTYSAKNSDTRVAILGGEDFKYQQLTATTTDLQTIELMNKWRDDIAALLHVPKSMYTSDDVNMANAKTGKEQFIELTILPLIKAFETGINEGILARIYTEPVYIEHDQLISEDKTEMVSELTAGVDKWITINEARKRSGLDPIGPEGDTLYRPSSTQDITKLGTTIPATTVTTPVQNTFKRYPYLYTKVKKYEKIITTITQHVKKSIVDTINIYEVPQVKDAYMRATRNATDKNIADLENEMFAFLATQTKRVIKAIADGAGENGDLIPVNVAEIFNIENENKLAVKSAMTVFPNMALRAGNAGRIPVKMFYAKSDDFTLDQETILLLAERSEFFATSINTNTFYKIQDQVSQQLAQGKGRNEIARHLRQYFADLNATRAKTIAQTEGTVISNIGLQKSFDQSEVVSGKLWLSAKDSKVRPEHQDNDGKQVSKDQAFPNGERYPGEKSVNCRCAIAPIVDMSKALKNY